MSTFSMSIVLHFLAARLEARRTTGHVAGLYNIRHAAMPY